MTNRESTKSVITKGLSQMGVNAECRNYLDGFALRARFANDYGASIISHFGSYGGSEGFWELAVIQYNGDTFELCYDTPITSDVCGWLEPEEVLELCKQIQAL